MNTKALRQKILDLAIHGKLVPQDPNDEPASVLLQRIKAEKERLIKEGKIKRAKKSKATCDKPHYPYQLPEGWAWCKLEDLAFYKKGPFGSSLTKAMFVPKGDDTYKVYEQKNAIQKDCTLGTYYITKDKYDSLSGFAVYPFDIIVSCAGTIGETYVLPQNVQEGIINQALMLIRLYSREIEQFYLLYFDFILKEEAKNSSKGTAIKNIPPFDVLKNFYIPIPPLKEQRRILDEISKWMSFVESIETDTSNLKDRIKQAKSKILDLAIHGKLVPQDPTDEPASELLKRINPKAEITSDNGQYEKLPKGWAVVKVGNAAEYINGRAFKPEEWESIGLPIVRIQNLNDADAHYNRTSVAHEQKYLIKDGDLLFAWAASLGTYIWTGGDAWLNQHIFKVKPYSFIYKSYLFYTFQAMISEFYRNSHGSGMVHITKKQFEEITLWLPPLSEQCRIVESLELTFNMLDSIAENI